MTPAIPHSGCGHSLSVAGVSARRAANTTSRSNPTTAAKDAILVLDDVAWAVERVASRASFRLATQQKG